MYDIKNLVQQAVNARSKALPTYSNFHVGAALLTEDGKVYTGANIENSSYSLTICAERTAVFKAVLEGEKKFTAIAIACDGEALCSPCGACRQVLSDLCGGNIDVIMANQKGDYKVYKLSELIPHSFGEEFLKP